MKSMLKGCLAGLCVGAMATAAIPSFSGAWWVFLIAGNVLATLLNQGEQS